MSFQEFKEIIGTILLGGALITIIISYLMYKIAEITYKRAHRPIKKVSNIKQNYAIIYNIDCKNKTLQEVQAEKRLMKGILANG